MGCVAREVAALAMAVGIAGCGLLGLSRAPRYDEPFFARKPHVTYTIPTPRAGVPSKTVIGSVSTVTVRDGDTLLDLARLHDLGFEELQQANPGVDAWLPAVATRLVVPKQFVLPCCTYEGLVVNIPELRAYFYRPGSRTATTIVETFPLGLGRGEYPTPMGVFRVKGKSINPAWGVPERIRQEHIRERGDPRKFIKGGDPDNPLGKYRIELDRTLYRIHSTNFPWGIGRLVSHGCVQLYPEDMDRLFPLVPVGTRVQFVYQPVKVGRDDDTTWVEAHRDIYRRRGRPLDQAVAALREQGLTADTARLRKALRIGDGVPRAVD